MKIGVFDSGIGGMTVLKQLIKEYPEHAYFYFGDTANVPYGSKSPETIQKLCLENAARIKQYNLDVLVVACNTASAIGLNTFKNELNNTPVIGVVEPGIQTVLEEFSQLNYEMDRRILILGTRATINSKIYSTELRKNLQFNEITEQACPLVVPLIEEGWINHPVCLEVIKEYVARYTTDKNPGIALLACTHYPWAQKVFEVALPGWKVVNSAKAISSYLKNHNLLSHSQKFEIHWYFTDTNAVSDLALNDFRDTLGIAIDLNSLNS